MSRISPFRLFLLIVALIFTLAACGSDDDSVSAGSDDGDADLPAADAADGSDSSGAAGGGATRPWIGGEWALQSLTVAGIDVTVPANAGVNLTINGPDSISGSAGCNSINGAILAPFDDDRDGGPLTITDLAMTEMACDLLDFEIQYVDALLAATEWELAPPSGLVFRGDGVELTYGIGAPQADVALENTVWLFDTIFDGEGVERTASSTRADKPQVTVIIAAAEATLTSDDCGTVTLGAGYEAGGSDGPITFEGTEAAFAACEDPESNMLSAIQGLADATGFQIFDGRLTLIGLPGETVSFVAADG
jgi:heat shock protein HslJ